MAELITSPALVAHKVKELEERIDKIEHGIMDIITMLEKELQTQKVKNGKKTKKNDR